MAIHSVYWHFLWWHDLGIHCILGNSCRSDKCEEGDEKEKMWAGGETQDRGGKTWQEEDTGKDSLLVSYIILGVMTQVAVEEKLIICFVVRSGKGWENAQIIMEDASQDPN